MQRSDALNGALVADAASMGLHWLYDQEQLQRVAATGDVLFRAPDAQTYHEKKGYFAHAGRTAGQLSHYGAHVEMLAKLLLQDQSYSVQRHRELFLSVFGPGGSWVGYADRPTKSLVAKMLLQVDENSDLSGADDDQMPAFAVVPALFHFDLADSLEDAVRVTNDNEMAVAGARVLAACLQALAEGEDLAQALRQSAAIAPAQLGQLLQQALAIEEYQPLQTAQLFGLPCHVPQGLPVAWHLLNHASDFESVVRDNILCGGDCCGRALAVGSIAGLAFGIAPHLQRQTQALVYGH